MLKRIREREIIVMKTDKSSRFVVTDEQEYLKMGEAHTKDDTKITRKTIIEMERQLNAHCVAWAKLWRSGSRLMSDTILAAP